MSRLIDMHNRLKGNASQEAIEKARQEAMRFEAFYNTAEYTVFKQSLVDKMAEMDRLTVADPAQLVLLQGKRQAYREILDTMEKKERIINASKK